MDGYADYIVRLDSEITDEFESEVFNNLFESELDDSLLEHSSCVQLFEHRGKPGMTLGKKAYGGSYGKRVKKFTAKRKEHEKKMRKATNKISKAYHSVSARTAKSKQSRYADHGKKDYIPGYRNYREFKTFVTGKY